MPQELSQPFNLEYGFKNDQERDFLLNQSLEDLKQSFGEDLNIFQAVVTRKYHHENKDILHNNPLLSDIKQAVGSDLYTKGLSHIKKPTGTESIYAIQQLGVQCIREIQKLDTEYIVDEHLRRALINANSSTDGILGPNTLSFLQDVAAWNGNYDGNSPELSAMSSWNGIITPQLIRKMLRMCHDDIVDRVKMQSMIPKEPDLTLQAKDPVINPDVVAFQDQIREEIAAANQEEPSVGPLLPPDKQTIFPPFIDQTLDDSSAGVKEEIKGEISAAENNAIEYTPGKFAWISGKGVSHLPVGDEESLQIEEPVQDEAMQDTITEENAVLTPDSKEFSFDINKIYNENKVLNDSYFNTIEMFEDTVQNHTISFEGNKDGISNINIKTKKDDGTYEKESFATAAELQEKYPKYVTEIQMKQKESYRQHVENIALTEIMKDREKTLSNDYSRFPVSEEIMEVIKREAKLRNDGSANDGYDGLYDHLLKDDSEKGRYAFYEKYNMKPEPLTLYLVKKYFTPLIKETAVVSEEDVAHQDEADKNAQEKARQEAEPEVVNADNKKLREDFLKAEDAAEKVAEAEKAKTQIQAEKDAAQKAIEEAEEAKKLAEEEKEKQESAEKLAAEKLAAETLAAEPLAAEPLAAEPLAADKLAADKLAAENEATRSNTATETRKYPRKDNLTPEQQKNMEDMEKLLKKPSDVVNTPDSAVDSEEISIDTLPVYNGDIYSLNPHLLYAYLEEKNLDVSGISTGQLLAVVKKYKPRGEMFLNTLLKTGSIAEAEKSMDPSTRSLVGRSLNKSSKIDVITLLNIEGNKKLSESWVFKDDKNADKNLSESWGFEDLLPVLENIRLGWYIYLSSTAPRGLLNTTYKGLFDHYGLVVKPKITPSYDMFNKLDPVLKQDIIDSYFTVEDGTNSFSIIPDAVKETWFEKSFGEKSKDKSLNIYDFYAIKDGSEWFIFDKDNTYVELVDKSKMNQAENYDTEYSPGKQNYTLKIR